MKEHFRIEIATLKHLLVQIDDFTLNSGKITFLFGESGIGKTLIAQTIFGLVLADQLRIAINGKTYHTYLHSAYLRNLQLNGFFVFQEPSTHLNPLMTIEDQLNEGSLSQNLNNRPILQSLWDNDFERSVLPLLHVYPKPFRPSGGEKQRFLLAMALKKMDLVKNQPQALFVFDEPTGSLDNHYRNLFLKQLFARYRQNPKTILFITHDYSIISEIENQHSDLQPYIDYRELRRVEGPRVKMFTFKPSDYLQWLQKQQPLKLKSGRQAPIVLRVKSPFGVFGKRFAFYRGKSKKAVDLVVKQGQITYLKAPSGLGKTTLAKIISGLQKSEMIQFELAGLSFNERTPRKIWQKKVWGKRVSMVFQHADEALNLKATVQEVFKGLPLQPPLTSDRLKAVLSEVFEHNLTPAFLDKPVAFLSGGQKQRLNLLRALLLHPALIILDEPLNGLDFNSIQRVLNIIEQKMSAGSGILLISHNEEIFDRLVPKEHIFNLKRRTP